MVTCKWHWRQICIVNLSGLPRRARKESYRKCTDPLWIYGEWYIIDVHNTRPQTGPLLRQPPTAAHTLTIAQHVRTWRPSVFDIREFQLIISCSPHKAPLSQTAILIMIFSSKTGNYDRSVEPVLHIKASKEPIWWVCTTPNGLEWSPQHYFRVTPRSLQSFCGAAAPGHWGLTASSVFFFFFFSKIKKEKSNNLWCTWKIFTSQMDNGSSNKGHRGSKVIDEAAIYQHLRWKGMFYLQLRFLKCISMNGSQRLANSLRQAMGPSLSICLCEKRHNGELILLLTQAGFRKAAKTLKFEFTCLFCLEKHPTKISLRIFLGGYLSPVLLLWLEWHNC